MTTHPETKAERKERLSAYLDTHSTCPTTDGQDLELWEELKGKRGCDQKEVKP